MYICFLGQAEPYDKTTHPIDHQQSPHLTGDHFENVMLIFEDKVSMGVSKNRGKTPKMDGENNGKPYINGWFGGTIIFGNTPIAPPTISVVFPSCSHSGQPVAARYHWQCPTSCWWARLACPTRVGLVMVILCLQAAGRNARMPKMYKEKHEKPTNVNQLNDKQLGKSHLFGTGKIMYLNISPLHSWSTWLHAACVSECGRCGYPRWHLRGPSSKKGLYHLPNRNLFHNMIIWTWEFASFFIRISTAFNYEFIYISQLPKSEKTNIQVVSKIWTDPSTF